MNIATSLLIAIALIAVIWIFVELKRFKHKMLAVLLIGLVITVYFSFTFVIKDQNINFKTVEGIKTATGIYFSWIGSLFTNFKTITSNAINLEWKVNNETEKETAR